MDQYSSHGPDSKSCGGGNWSAGREGGYCWPGDRPAGNRPNNTLNGPVYLAGVFAGLFSGEEAQVPGGAAAMGGYCSGRYTT